MKRLIFLCLAIQVTCTCFSFSIAQNLSGRIWIFPDSCGVDFRDTNNVTAFYGTNLYTWSSGAAISSANGNLLFYSDGTRVKDERNQYVENFDSISLTYGYNKTFFFQTQQILIKSVCLQ